MSEPRCLFIEVHLFRRAGRRVEFLRLRRALEDERRQLLRGGALVAAPEQAGPDRAREPRRGRRCA